MSKFALISHILPPSPSGQAVVLHRLLSRLPDDAYCLIYASIYKQEEDCAAATDNLNGPCHALSSFFRLPEYNGSWPFVLSVIINTMSGIFLRARQITKIAIKEKVSAIVACTGEPYNLPAAYLASRQTGLPLIPYIFDDYAFHWTGYYRIIARFFEPRIIRHAAGIIVTNEFMQMEYLRRFNRRSIVIHNLYEVAGQKVSSTEAADRDDEEKRIVYAGSIYHAHYDAFCNLLVALKHLDRSDIKLHIYTSQHEADLAKKGIHGDAVVYHSHIDSESIAEILRTADILFLPLAFNSPIPEVIRTSSPGKTAEYLASGRPILVHAPEDSFVCWYFRKHKCGMVVSQKDPVMLSGAIEELLSDEGLTCRLAEQAAQRVKEDFEAGKLADMFSGFISTCRDRYVAGG